MYKKITQTHFDTYISYKFGRFPSQMQKSVTYISYLTVIGFQFALFADYGEKKSFHENGGKERKKRSIWHILNR